MSTVRVMAAAILATASWLVPTVASAQDVVVMRRAITAGTYGAHEWKTGDWVKGAPSCSTTAVQTRTVACVRKADGVAVASSLCRGSTPATTMRYDDQRTCVVSTTCGTPQTGIWHTGTSATYAIKQDVRTAAEAQAACNDYLANTKRVGVCAWDSNSNVYGVGKENGTVSFAENGVISPASSYPALWASACTRP